MPRGLSANAGPAHIPTADFLLQGVIVTRIPSPASGNPEVLEARKFGLLCLRSRLWGVGWVGIRCWPASWRQEKTLAQHGGMRLVRGGGGGCTTLCRQVPVGCPVLKWGALWGKARGCADIDDRSRNQRAVATATAGSETGIGETRHASGTSFLVKGSENVLAFLNGTASSESLVCSGVRAGGAAAVPPQRGMGAAYVPGADRCVDPPFPRLVSGVQGCL